MNEPPIHPIAVSVEARDQELAREFRKLKARLVGLGLHDFCCFPPRLHRYRIQSPGSAAGAETIFRINIVDVVFCLIATVVLFNVYVFLKPFLSRGFAASSPRNRAIRPSPQSRHG